MRSEGYCSWVCLCVCLLSHISPLERLFVLKTLSRTQRATKVKKFVGVFSETAPLQRSSTPSVDGHTYSRPFFLRKARMRMGLAPPSVFPSSWRIIISPPLASLPQRMWQSGLPADAGSLRETGSVDRYTPPVGPCPSYVAS